VAVAQGGVDELDERGATVTPMLRPRRCATSSRRWPVRMFLSAHCAASIAAQRTTTFPCLVIRPRCTVVSDS
jgi:hypothetical protein